VFDQPATRGVTGWPLIGALMVTAVLIGGFFVFAVHDVKTNGMAPLKVKACGHTKTAKGSNFSVDLAHWQEQNPIPEVVGGSVYVRLSSDCSHGARVTAVDGVSVSTFIAAKDKAAEWVRVKVGRVDARLQFADAAGAFHVLTFSGTA
jgi:hypothetical protein